MFTDGSGQRGAMSGWEMACRDATEQSGRAREQGETRKLRYRKLMKPVSVHPMGKLSLSMLDKRTGSRLLVLKKMR